MGYGSGRARVPQDDLTAPFTIGEVIAGKYRLERVGSDTTCDGHVDRWDRDTILLAAEDAAQEKAAAAESGSDDAGARASTPLTVGASGEITDGGPPVTKPTKRHAK